MPTPALARAFEPRTTSYPPVTGPSFVMKNIGSSGISAELSRVWLAVSGILLRITCVRLSVVEQLLRNNYQRLVQVRHTPFDIRARMVCCSV